MSAYPQPIYYFDTEVNEIPCVCRVDYYRPGRADRIGGAMEDAEEGYDEEFVYTMLDHRGIIAPWIAKQMDREDEERLVDEFHLEVAKEKYMWEDSP